MPTTSYPSSRSMTAAVDESTPPLMATSTRPFLLIGPGFKLAAALPAQAGIIPGRSASPPQTASFRVTFQTERMRPYRGVSPREDVSTGPHRQATPLP